MVIIGINRASVKEQPQADCYLQTVHTIIKRISLREHQLVHPEYAELETCCKTRESGANFIHVTLLYHHQNNFTQRHLCIIVPVHPGINFRVVLTKEALPAYAWMKGSITE